MQVLGGQGKRCLLLLSSRVGIDCRHLSHLVGSSGQPGNCGQPLRLLNVLRVYTQGLVTASGLRPLKLRVRASGSCSYFWLLTRYAEKRKSFHA